MKKFIQLSMALTVLTSVSALANCPALKPTDEIFTKKMYEKDDAPVTIDGKEWVIKTENPLTPPRESHDMHLRTGTQIEVSSGELLNMQGSSVCFYKVMVPIDLTDLPKFMRGKLWGRDLYLITKEEFQKLKASKGA